jgi:hypothetical protein
MAPHWLVRPKLASGNSVFGAVALKKVAQLARGAADLTADRCERPCRERPGSMNWNAHMPTVCMPHYVVAASDPFQVPATLPQD